MNQTLMRKIIVLAMLLPAAMGALAQGTVSLDSCRRMAIHNNRELQKSQIGIEKAGYQREQARAAYLPTVDFEAGYVYNTRKISLIKEDALLPVKNFNPSTGTYDYALVTGPDGMPIQVNGSYVPSQVALLPKSAMTYDIHNLIGGAVTVKQPIYMGGKIRAMNAITGYAQQLAQSMHDSKVEEVVYSVDQAYWQVVSLGAKKQLVEGYLKLVTQLDQDVEKMVNEGVATRANKLTVDVKVNEGNVDLVKVEDGLALSRMLLNQLCGLPIGTQYTLADEGRDDLGNALRPSSFDLDSVYSRRHDIKALQLASEIADQQALVTRSEMLPTVAAFANYSATNPNSYNGYENRFGFGLNVGVVVKVPLWHWGGPSNKYKASLADARMRKVELADAKEKIALQANQASFRYQEAWKTFEKTRANLVQANENLRCANLGFHEGVATVDDVLTAQTAWLKAYSDNIDAQIDIQLCDVYLQKVLGEMSY